MGDAWVEKTVDGVLRRGVCAAEQARQTAGTSGHDRAVLMAVSCMNAAVALADGFKISIRQDPDYMILRSFVGSL